MPKLTERITKLEQELQTLKDKIADISRNTEEGSISPYSKAGGLKDPSQVRPTDIETGLGATFGGNIPWNDSELKLPPWKSKPSEPTKGYHKHGHSNYAGGALDINTLELVEYDVDFDSSSKFNKHCQGFWAGQFGGAPPVKKVQDSEGRDIRKIGNLDIEFDPNTKKWKAGSAEIDVRKTFLILREDDGTIRLDENGVEMKSPLYNEEDELKSIISWDKDAQCWKFYAIFRPYEE